MISRKEKGLPVSSPTFEDTVLSTEALKLAQFIFFCVFSVSLWLNQYQLDLCLNDSVHPLLFLADFSSF